MLLRLCWWWCLLVMHLSGRAEMLGGPCHILAATASHQLVLLRAGCSTWNCWFMCDVLHMNHAGWLGQLYDPYGKPCMACTLPQWDVPVPAVCAHRLSLPSCKALWFGLCRVTHARLIPW